MGNGEAANHELASPLLADDLRFLPRTLLMYGGAEALRGQAEVFAERVGRERICVVVGSDMVHGFPIFSGVAYGQTGRYIACASVAILALVLFLTGLLLAAALVYCDACPGRGPLAAAAALVGIAFAAALLRARFVYARLRCAGTNCNETTAELTDPLQAFSRIKLFAAEIWQDSAPGPGP